MRFENGEAYLTDYIADADLFYLSGGSLFLDRNNYYVGASTASGWIALEQLSDQQSSINGWFRDGDRLKFGEAIGFCVADALNVILELTHRPPFQCDGYDLIAGNIDGRTCIGTAYASLH